jgi:hypothetical protein
MTVSTDQNRSTFLASGLTRDFDFPFPYQVSSDIHAFVRTALGAQRELGANEFAVSNPGAGVGGRLSLSVFPAAGDRISVVRIPQLFQETVLDENTTFFLKTIERAFDRQTMYSQRLSDLISRALVLPDADIAGSGAYLAGGNRISNLAPGTADNDAVTLAQAVALLGSGSGGGGGGGGGTPVATWPTDPVPQSIVDQVLNNSALLSLFSPINVQVGNLASQVLALNSTNASISTSIGTINTSITSMQADIDLLQQLQGDGTEIVTLITTETSQRIAGDAAQASVLAKIGAADADGVSFLMNLATAKIGATETLGQRFSGITTSLNANSASIASEATARTNAVNALATTISKIGALTDAGASFLFDLNTAKVGPTETFAQRLAGIASQLGSVSAAITTEQNARSSADGSLASSITTLQSSVSGFDVAIQANATAINGVGAKYTVKIDNNGRVTGYGLISAQNNGAPVSAFVVLADAFKVFNGSTDVAPFQVVGGVVTMQNVRITGNLIVDGDITTPKLADNAASKIDIVDGSASVGLTNAGYTTAASVTITTIGKPVCVHVNVPGPFSFGTFVRIQRDGSDILAGQFVDQGRALFSIDTPPAGTHTYNVQMLSSGSTYTYAGGIDIAAIEVRK